MLSRHEAEGQESASAPQLSVVLVAAGRSARMNGRDKVFAPLQGKPVLAWSLSAFQSSPLVGAVAVVLAPHNVHLGKQICTEAEADKVVAVVQGGSRRQDSVLQGLRALEESGRLGSFVAVHDGARPFVDTSMIERGLRAAVAHQAAVAAIPVVDTIKEVDEAGVVQRTLDRKALRAIQTPQVFQSSLLLRAFANVHINVTDDAALVEQTGVRVAVFEGDRDNLKITTPGDLEVAEAIALRRTGATPTVPHSARVRWGTGFDGHGLAEGGPLKLGGIAIPYERHLAGHSDGDVLLHAVASAILGASGLGDLGTHFPSSDAALAGIDSAEILARSSAKARNRGWLTTYLDATIVAQQPRLGPHLDAMRRRIADVLGLPATSVNVKVTSTDRVGAIGRGEGIAAQAIATLQRISDTITAS